MGILVLRFSAVASSKAQLLDECKVSRLELESEQARFVSPIKTSMGTGSSEHRFLSKALAFRLNDEGGETKPPRPLLLDASVGRTKMDETEALWVDLASLASDVRGTRALGGRSG